MAGQTPGVDDRTAYRARPAEACPICDAPVGARPVRSQRFYNAAGKQVLLFEVLKGMSWTRRVVSDPCCSSACEAAWWERHGSRERPGARPRPG